MKIHSRLSVPVGVRRFLDSQVGGTPATRKQCAWFQSFVFLLKRVHLSGGRASRFRALAVGILSLFALLAPARAAQLNYTVLQNFFHSTEGENPRSALLLASDGALYGSLFTGGPLGDGVLFRIQRDGTGFTVLRYLDGSDDGRYPRGKLLEGSDGRLYGTTSNGGHLYDRGTVFALNRDGTGFTVLRQLVNVIDGGTPYAGLIEGSDGRLYGTCTSGGPGAASGYGDGTVFALNRDGTGFTPLRWLQSASDGAQPYAGLIEGRDGRLYGTTRLGGANVGGTVFTLNRDGTGFTVLRHLQSSNDGAAPYASLIEGSDARLYGTTSSGGASGTGTIFALNANGTGFTVLRNPAYSSDGSSPSGALLPGSDGRLYGACTSGGPGSASGYGDGTIFAINMDGTGFTVLRHLSATIDGNFPVAGLEQDGSGRLYGTTFRGGTYTVGTILAIDPDGTDFTVLRHISSWSDGRSPKGSVVQGSDGRLFGTTTAGGDYASGTLFALNTDGTGFTALHHLQRASDGAFPYAGLLRGDDGRFYGTAYTGGRYDDGTVFAINADGKGFTVLRDLQYSSDGELPTAELVTGSDGRLYGTTSLGGTYGYGTIFALNANGTGFTVLRHLQHATDGGYPKSALVEGSDGRLYGTTSLGGTYGYGTIYALNANGTGFTVLRHLQLSSDGGESTSGLIQGNDGRLFGTMPHGGTYAQGTIFTLNTDGTGFAVLRHLDYASDGGTPDSGLIEGRDGLLYGTTTTGARGDGTLFRLSPDGSGFVVVHYFVPFDGDGGGPYGRLFQGSDGTFYGTTAGGGTYGQGTVFAYSPGDVLTDIDAQAYISAEDLSGNAAATVNRIVLELKGLYAGPDRINTTGTNYWNSAVDFWLFDRGLNANNAGVARSLKLGHPVALNGATLDAVNGLHTDGINDRPNTILEGPFTGITALVRASFNEPAVVDAVLWRLGTRARDSGGYFYTHEDVIFGQAAGDGRVLMQGLGNAANGRPIFYSDLVPVGTADFDSWVSANGARANWKAGATGGTDGAVQFGTAGDNFSPTHLGWGYKLGDAGFAYAFQSANVKFTALLNRTTTAAERDELKAILARPVIVASNGPVITSAATAAGTYGVAFNYTITATNAPTSFGAGSLPPGLNADGSSGLISGTPAQAGTFASTVSATNDDGTGQANLSIVIAKAAATVWLSNLTDTYDGTPKSATATTSPSGLSVALTYNGSPTPPTNAGSYAVVATITDPNYAGSSSGTLTIKAAATVTLSDLVHTYNGASKNATTTTAPAGLPVTLTYNGSSTPPTNAGSYTVVGTIADTNYTGFASGTLTISPAAATIVLSNLAQNHNGSPRSATATTSPAGLAVSFTYDGSATAPTNVGTYAVVGTINNPNYQGSVRGTLVISEAPNPGDSTYTVLQNFFAWTERGKPKSALLLASDGALYGSLFKGGPFGDGVLFRIQRDGTGFTVLRYLDGSDDGGSPRGKLLEGSDGRLYGITSNGGHYGHGTLFALNHDGTGFTILRDLQYSSDGDDPHAGLIEGSDGRLYGTTFTGGTHGNGTLFAINRDGTGFSVLRHLGGNSEGANAAAGLLEGSDGRLYGTTVGGGSFGSGTIFAINRNGTGFTVLRHLDTGSSDSSERPLAGLIEGSDGRLYGTSFYAGTYNHPLNLGTVFALYKDGTGFTVLRRFLRASGGYLEAAVVQGSDGRLFGTTTGGGVFDASTLFAMNTDGTGHTVLRHLNPTTDGRRPKVELVQDSSGRLYGATWDGGPYSDGTLFAIDPDGTDFTVLRSISLLSDGSHHIGEVVLGADGRLFGITPDDGDYSDGTVFALNSNGTNFKVLHHFQHSSGGNRLIQGRDGRLYGTTYDTIFSISAYGGDFTVLRDMQYSSDGNGLYARLVEGSDGRLYGAARFGGTYNGGTLFALNTDGTGFIVLRHLQYQSDGIGPYAGLVEGNDGRLYGTTREGGMGGGGGTIFAINRNGTGFTVLRHLESSRDGADSYSPLLQGSDGRLYGVLSYGGSHGGGTIFAVNTDGTDFTVLRNLENVDAFHERRAGLIEGRDDGRLYGTAGGGGSNGGGTLFRLNPDGSAFVVLRNFDRANGDGSAPYAKLIQAPDGTFYGTTSQGGAYDQGTVFSYSLGETSVRYEVEKYIDDVGLSGNAAATVNRIVLELKGLYKGPDRINTTGTNYWSSAVDFWLFDRGLNANNGGVARSLRLTHPVTLNGATLDAVNGLSTDGINDGPNTLLEGPFTGITALVRASLSEPAVINAVVWRLGTTARDGGSAGYTHENVIFGQAAGDGRVLMQGLAIPTNGRPMFYSDLVTVGTADFDSWVSANGARANWKAGATGGTDGAVQFGTAGDNFAPTELGWGYKRGSGGTPASFLVTNTKFSALLRRTTTTAERDQLLAILALPLLTSNAPQISSLPTAAGTFGVLFNYTITATNSPTSFAAGSLPPGLSVNGTSGLISNTPTQAGTFASTVSATNADGTGQANLSITIAKAAATVGLSNLAPTYDGTPKSATATTSPFGLSVVLTYDGSATAPSAAGSYAVHAEIADVNYTGSADGVLVIAPGSGPVYDSDAQAYITAVGLSGTAAASINRIVLELKGLYDGPDRINTTGTNYWDSAVDFWLFDRGLNASRQDSASIAADSLKLAHMVFLNGATLDAVNGLHADGINNTPVTFIGGPFTGVTVLVRASFNEPAVVDAVLWRLGTRARDSGSAGYTHENVILGQAAGDGKVFMQGLAIPTNGRPMFYSDLVTVGTADFDSWVSADGTRANWRVGASGGTDGAVQFGTMGDNFSPTQLGWGYKTEFYQYPRALFSFQSANVKFTALLNRTTSAAERDELIAILALPVIVPSQRPVITRAATAAGTYGVAFNYTITATNAPTSFGAGSLPPGLNADGSSGLISGTPAQAGTFASTMSATNGDGTGQANLSIVIAKAAATVGLSNLAPTYDGTPKSATATTSPFGLSVVLTYDGSATAPSAAGLYAVHAEIADVNYTGSADGVLVIAPGSGPVYDPDAQAYITAVSLSGTAAASINRIVLELKGLYDGPDRINTTGTNYWDSAVDFWLFDRGLNASRRDSATIAADSLKLAHMVFLNGATLDAVNGLHTDGINNTPVTFIGGPFTGVTVLVRASFNEPAVVDAVLWRLGTMARDGGSAGYTHENVILGQAAGDGKVFMQGLAIPTNGRPMFYSDHVTVGTADFDSWVSANGARANWKAGATGGTDGAVQFGTAGDNFSPTQLGWGYKLGDDELAYAFQSANVKFTALLNRTTTAAERDQLLAILALP